MLAGVQMIGQAVNSRQEGVGVARPWRVRDPQLPSAKGTVEDADWQGLAPDAVAALVEALPGAAILIDSRDQKVLTASEQAYDLGLVSADRLVIRRFGRLVGGLSPDTTEVEDSFAVRKVDRRVGRVDLGVRAIWLDSTTSLLLVDDLTAQRRVDEVRRDFVANVSHELKTPVGALSLLAEAVIAASDDPEAVEHFAGRMQVESARLADLVGDLVELSRLQGDDADEDLIPTDVDSIVSEAVDATRLLAHSAGIDVVIGGTDDLVVMGIASQLTTAVRNLLTNAVVYSPQGTRVAVTKRQRADVVEISVTDQGIGIPGGELDRIFERFYRIDPARSRESGGTGLGLSIVKHVVANHHGEVRVWSVEGEGSTFTLRIPRDLRESRANPDNESQETADAAEPKSGRRGLAARYRKEEL